MLKKNPRKNMETLKVPGVAKESNIDTQALKKKDKEWRSSRLVKTNMETPKKFYLEYS